MAEVITEAGFVVTFIERIFDAIVRQRSAAIRKAAERDPEFKRILGNLERSRSELEAWIKKNRDDPEFAAANDAVRQVLHK